MSTLRGRSQIGPDGYVHIKVSGGLVNTEVEYTLEYPAASGKATGAHNTGNGEVQNGEGNSPGTRWDESANLGPKPSPEERRRRLNKAIGSIDDPTFVRPPQGEYEKREPLD